MKIKIEIKGGNAAFGETPFDAATEVSRILRELGEKLENRGITDDDEIYLFDYNGNRVGKMVVSE